MLRFHGIARMILSFVVLVVVGLATSAASLAEKLYVVERGRGKVAVIQEQQRTHEIGDLGKLHHATIKFWNGFAFIISRDGWLSRIDTDRKSVV